MPKLTDKAERLGDMVFGAMDGLISTLAVVAGVSGASASNFIVIVAGASAMLAEALSMGFSSYISREVRQDVLRRKEKERPIDEAVMFWLATMGGGLVPILPFLLLTQNPLQYSVGLSVLFLFGVGAYTSKFTGKGWLYSGIRSALIGGVAAILTYAVGYGFSLIA